MSVKIIADSACDVPQSMARELGMRIVPMQYQMQGELFLDGVSLTHEEFHRRMREWGQLPTTTQLTPAELLAVFEEELAAGDQELVFISISSNLSGNHQSAAIARELSSAPERIFVADSLSFTLSEGTVVMAAYDYAQTGATGQQVADFVYDIAHRLHFYTIIGDIKHLQLGGRLSPGKAAVAKVMALRPIVYCDDGHITPVYNALGFQKAFDWLWAGMKDLEIDYSLPLCLGHAYSEENCQKFIRYLDGKLDISRFPRVCNYPTNAVTGTHSGPNCVGIAYYTKKKD